jgi:adenine-specific DNA-methyltransferase
MRTRLQGGTIPRARRLRAHATDAERQLWYKLRELKRLGFHFRRQVPFRSYILDFAEHSAGLVIELDGGQHGDDRHRARDFVRDRVLQTQGYRVLRFWNHEVIEHGDVVLDYILAQLMQPPTRPPSRESAPASDLPTRGR